MRSFYKFLIVVIIIGAGFIILQGLVRTKPQAKRRPVSIAVPVVEVLPLVPVTSRIMITATGLVIPAREVSLQPQVTGVVVWQNPKLIPGSLVREGEELVHIDPRDYELALEQQRSALTKARVELETELGRAAVARREWELLGGEVEVSAAGRDLALRKPQLKNAEAALVAAQSALDKAALDLERTTIRAPFNAVVLGENVEEGQRLSPGTTIATLAGSDSFRVQASVLHEDLAWIDIPGLTMTGSPSVGMEASGSRVRVLQRSGETLLNHTGFVERLLRDVDPQGRMARLLIRVPEPLKADGSAPLLLGSYVTLEIAGQEVQEVYVIPREALREDGRVWLLDESDTLEVRQVPIVWRRHDDALVRGLEPGERLITSRIAAPVPGMQLRLNGNGHQAPLKGDHQG